MIFFASKCFFHLNFELVGNILIKFENVTQFDGVFFWKKSFHPSKRYLLQNLEGGKYAGGSRKSCLILNLTATT